MTRIALFLKSDRLVIFIKDNNGNKIDYKKVSNNEYEFVMPDTYVIIKPIYKEVGLINVSDILKSDDSNRLLISILFMLIGLGIGICIYKKKESR